VKKIPIIINPAAGGKGDLPPEILNNAGLDPRVLKSGRAGEVNALASRLAGESDIVAVYGGDGTVTEAARALYGTSAALAILPGGTANVMAKELNIPLDIEKSVALLREGHSVRQIDMGVVNGCPFLIRVNLGLFSDMITETDPEMKEKWGQLAYGLTAFQTLGQEPDIFGLTIDGKSFDQDAVALTVTNAGNVGRAGYSFLPDISVTDGWLDVIALDKSDIGSLLKVTGSILFQKDSAVLKHWRAKEVLIKLPSAHSWLCDDVEEVATELHIRVAPAALRVLVPEENVVVTEEEK
jgi:diacylglycerol kinase (ATP)